MVIFNDIQNSENSILVPNLWKKYFFIYLFIMLCQHEHKLFKYKNKHKQQQTQTRTFTNKHTYTEDRRQGHHNSLEPITVGPWCMHTNKDLQKYKLELHVIRSRNNT